MNLLRMLWLSVNLAIDRVAFSVPFTPSCYHILKGNDQANFSDWIESVQHANNSLILSSIPPYFDGTTEKTIFLQLIARDQYEREISTSIIVTVYPRYKVKGETNPLTLLAYANQPLRPSTVYLNELFTHGNAGERLRYTIASIEPLVTWLENPEIDQVRNVIYLKGTPHGSLMSVLKKQSVINLTVHAFDESNATANSSVVIHVDERSLEHEFMFFLMYSAANSMLYKAITLSKIFLDRCAAAKKKESIRVFEKDMLLYKLDTPDELATTILFETPLIEKTARCANRVYSFFRNNRPKTTLDLSFLKAIRHNGDVYLQSIMPIPQNLYYQTINVKVKGNYCNFIQEERDILIFPFNECEYTQETNSRFIRRQQQDKPVDVIQPEEIQVNSIQSYLENSAKAAVNLKQIHPLVVNYFTVNKHRLFSNRGIDSKLPKKTTYGAMDDKQSTGKNGINS